MYVCTYHALPSESSEWQYELIKLIVISINTLLTKLAIDIIKRCITSGPLWYYCWEIKRFFFWVFLCLITGGVPPISENSNLIDGFSMGKELKEFAFVAVQLLSGIIGPGSWETDEVQWSLFSCWWDFFETLSLLLQGWTRLRKMVYYFTSHIVSPPASIYVGKDKFESTISIQSSIAWMSWAGDLTLAVLRWGAYQVWIRTGRLVVASSLPCRSLVPLQRFADLTWYYSIRVRSSAFPCPAGRLNGLTFYLTFLVSCR